MIYPKKSVLFDHKTGRKFIVLNSDQDYSTDQFSFVCNRPHADNDYSYLCTNNWCRCQQ